ncbi:response regulator [Leisingera sp. ANG-Vp]|uniref:response regulator n=1 Tax=Leisingera sp. ANG-Vp TaxID=1577896 RepID=UPI00068EC096|nr:response regulator [Leisingera sp. ANG-Vp]
MLHSDIDPIIDRVLLIDDDRADQLFYRRIIQRSGLVGELVMFDYASDALDYLTAGECPRVDLILLDINMPRMNGFEFLEAATGQLGEGFVKVLVVMLSSSLNPRDIALAEQFEVVKAYLCKPLDQQGLNCICNLYTSGGQRGPDGIRLLN